MAHAASIHTQRWAAFFHDQGHECHILSLTPSNADTVPGVIYHILPHPFRIRYEQSNWHYLLQLPALWRLLRQIQPDLLNAHFLSSYGFLAALICPPKLPLVITLYGSDILIIPKRSLLHRWIAVFALGRARLITSVAQHMTAALRHYVPADKPVLTLQYGINTQTFSPRSELQPRLPVALSTRAMVKVSQLDTLIQAAVYLRERQIPLQFHLAGSGELRPELEKQAADLGLQETLHFIGQIPPAAMPDALRQAALYVSTSASDGASLALLEALACGTFPIVTDIPANQEWIQNGKNGLLFHPGSAADLAEKLAQAWQDEDLRRQAAAYNKQMVQERADYRSNMHIIEQAFKDLLPPPLQELETPHE